MSLGSFYQWSLGADGVAPPQEQHSSSSLLMDRAIAIIAGASIAMEASNIAPFLKNQDLWLGLLLPNRESISSYGR